MSTLSEFLKLEKNQAIVLWRIIEILRTSGSWGKRGLFVKIANETGFSAAYVGQVLTGKKPLTDEFVVKIANYLKVCVAYLRGDKKTDDDAPDKTPSRIVEFLKAAVAGSSLHDVAADYGISESVINQHMDGIGYPSTDTLFKLSKHTGLPIDYLINEGPHLYSQVLSDFAETLKRLALLVSASVSDGIPSEDKLDLMEKASNAAESAENLAQKLANCDPEMDIIHTFYALPDDLREEAKKAVKIAKKGLLQLSESKKES